MTNQYDTGMSKSSPAQGHSNGIPGAEYYSLQMLEDFVNEIRLRHGIDDLGQSVLRSGSNISESDQETPRPNTLLQSHLFNTQFKDSNKFNTSLLDLRTNARNDHKIMAALLELCLTPTVKYTVEGGIRADSKVWVIHLFCYDIPVERFSPLTLSVIILKTLLARLRTKPSTKHRNWGHFEVIHKSTRTENPSVLDHNRIMDVLHSLISRFLKECSEHTIHFVFTGIKYREFEYRRLYELSSFFIVMARLVRTVQNDRMVKCIFCGDGLLDLLDCLEQKKERLKQGTKEENKDIQLTLARTLMLRWNDSEACWHEQDLVSHFVDREKAMEEKPKKDEGKKRRDYRS